MGSSRDLHNKNTTTHNKPPSNTIHSTNNKNK